MTGKSAQTWRDKAVHWFARTVVLLVATGAAILSFDALTSLAVAAGVGENLAWMWAVVIDGFILVATIAAFTLKDRGLKVVWYPWTTLGVFVILSMVGNGFHAAIAETDYKLPLEVAVIVTAIPPIALFMAIHMLIVMTAPTEEEKKLKARHAAQLARKQRIEDRKLEAEEKAEMRLVDKTEKESLKAAVLMEVVPKASAPVKPAKTVSAAPVTPQPALLGNAEVTTEKRKTEPIADSKISLLELGSQVDEPTNALNDEAMVTVSSAPAARGNELELFHQFVAENGKTPTGPQFAQLLGKSVRTGQVALRKIRDAEPGLFN